MLQSFLVVLGCSPRGLDAKLSSEKHPNGADVLYEHDFRVVSFHRGTELGWKTFLWLSTSHMWEQKHTKVEIKTWQKKKKNPKNETKNPHPNQCFWNLREKNNNNKKKRVFFWFLVKALVGCCLTKLGLKCVQSDRFLWTWHLQNGLVAPALSHKVDICHGRHWEEQTAQVSNCAESPGAFPPGDRICLEGG